MMRILTLTALALTLTLPVPCNIAQAQDVLQEIGNPDTPVANPVIADAAPPKADDNEIRIQLTPAEQAMLASRMDGKIADIPVKDGDVVKQGDVLIKFECDEQSQMLAQAKARMDRQDKLLASARKLAQLGSGSKLDLNVRQAEAAEASASLQLAQTAVSQCEIRAPFAGRVAALPVKQFQSVRNNDLLVELIQDSDLEVEMMVPSSWLSWLDEGTDFPVVIDETGKTYEAEVSNIGGRVDPITQTVKIYAILSAREADLLAGMTGIAKFDSLKPAGKKEPVANKTDLPAKTPSTASPPAANDAVLQR